MPHRTSSKPVREIILSNGNVYYLAISNLIHFYLNGISIFKYPVV